MPQSITLRLLKCAVAAFCFSQSISASNSLAQCPELGWRVEGGDVNGTIHAMIEFDDGTGRAIFVAGEFTEVGGSVGANRIAKWDGKEWSPLHKGANDTIYTLAVHDDGNGPALYAGGNFTSIGDVAARRIAKWDGDSWTAIGTGVNGTVRAIVGHADRRGSVLYIGGDFTGAGGQLANRIAQWNGQSWSRLSTGMDGSVLALAIFDDGSGPALFAAGNFSMAGGTAGPSIAKWTGTVWWTVGNADVNGSIRILMVLDDGSGPALYAAGSFNARWNGIQWSPFATNISGTVQALGAHPQGSAETLYVSIHYGDPTIWYGGISRWEGSEWTTMGSATFTGLHANALCISDIGGSPALYAGGAPSGYGIAMRFAVWTFVDSFINHNANLFDDSCELANGLVWDCNANGIPDETESTAAYALDDGAYMECWGVNVYRDFLWLNQFTVRPGQELITHVSVASPYGAPDGWPYQVHLFSDPNQDGNPIDAELLASGSSAFLYTGWWDVARFSPVAIPPTWVGPSGTKFFVGVSIDAEPGLWFAASEHNFEPSQHSWVKVDKPGEMNVAELSEGHPPQLLTSARWMLRALSMDCNSTGTWDQCDIDEGVSFDLNRNGIPDECEPVPQPCAIADIAPPGGDASIGVPDLLTIINAWGPCANPNDCPADIAPPDGDDFIGVPDVLAVINAWGPCPQ